MKDYCSQCAHCLAKKHVVIYTAGNSHVHALVFPDFASYAAAKPRIKQYREEYPKSMPDEFSHLVLRRGARADDYAENLTNDYAQMFERLAFRLDKSGDTYTVVEMRV